MALDACTGLAFKTVLDIGSGDGVHAANFRDMGKTVTTLDIKPPADIVGKYTHKMVERFDLIWCCHVLEHQLDVNQFLSKCFFDLNHNGYLVITVPPLKNEIVGGHLTLWNAGLLLYNLILAGFDCREAKVATYDYNVSVIVQKKAFEMPKLRMDFGDIEVLSEFFPIPVCNGFNGHIQRCNW